MAKRKPKPPPPPPPPPPALVRQIPLAARVRLSDAVQVDWHPAGAAFRVLDDQTFNTLTDAAFDRLA